MTQKEAHYKRNMLEGMRCYDENSVLNLRSFLSELQHVEDYLISASTKVGILDKFFRRSPFTEARICLDVWLKKRIKRTMLLQFNEAHSDMKDDLSYFVRFGDEHSLWKAEP